MTVKELAELCNVHYNTMRRWLSDSDIPKKTNAKNAQFKIDGDVVEKAKKHFGFEEDIQESESSMVFYQKIIEDQKNQIENLQRLLENQQILTLKSQKRIERLENKDKVEDVKEDIELDQQKKWYEFWKE